MLPHVTERREAQQPQSPGWFALRLRSRFEFAVRDQLRAADVPEFLPTMTEETRWTDRTNLTTRPLFAGYIFAQFDPSSRDTVLRTRGVVQILSIDQQPVPISDEEIANLRLFVGAAARVEPGPYVAVGSAVRVERGPFAGVEGIVTRTKGQATLTISVEILGRSVNVALDPADVEEL